MNLLDKIDKLWILKRSKKDIGVGEKDYNNNIGALKRKLTIRLVSGILGTTIILLFIFTTLSIRSIDSMLETNFLEKLERSREQRKTAIEEYYASLGREMEREIKVGASGSSFMETNSKTYERFGIEEVALFNSEYQLVYQSSDRDLLPIKKEIKSLKFQRPFYIQKMVIDDDSSSQHLFYKIFREEGGEDVLYYKINSSSLNKLLSVSPFKADILNDEFYIIASNRVLDATEYVINDISKKMLDGRVGTDFFNDNIYSYTYINLEENPVYLNMYEEVALYKAPLLRYKTKVYLLWVISVIGTLSVILFIRLSADSYSIGVSRVNIEREGDKKYKFLKKELIDVFEELEDVEGSLDKLRVFTTELDGIKKKIAAQNSYSIEKIKEDEKTIEKIEADEELKKKIKERL